MQNKCSNYIQTCRVRFVKKHVDLIFLSLNFVLDSMKVFFLINECYLIMNCFQMKEPLVKPSLSFYLQLIFKSCRLTFWALLLELSAHFLYTQSLIYQHSLLEKCDDFTFCSYFIVLGISFHMKYLVMYGTGNTLARFDLLMPPPEPRCVVHVGSYTDMWRCVLIILQ